MAGESRDKQGEEEDREIARLRRAVMINHLSLSLIEKQPIHIFRISAGGNLPIIVSYEELICAGLSGTRVANKAAAARPLDAFCISFVYGFKKNIAAKCISSHF